jgi:omega-hydroxy-beta-dihydromenaquinone-9 sulfotransferase
MTATIVKEKAAGKSSRAKHTTQGGLLLWHGMTISGVWRFFRTKPMLHWSRLHRTLTIPPMALYNSVMSAVESLIYGRRVQKTEIKEAPLFVLGYWRSGTTYLQNLLSHDPQFQHLGLYRTLFPWHFLLTEKVVTTLTAPFVPKTRPMDNIAVSWDAPQEDDVALCVMSQVSPCMLLAHPDDFTQFRRTLDFETLPPRELNRWKKCLQLLTKKLTYISGKRLILKSPIHTYHIPTLLEMFPDAKFLYLHRNPYDVFKSSCHLRRTLISENTLGRDVFEGTEEEVIDSFRLGFEVYQRDKQLIPAGNLSEVGYDDLTADPSGELRRIYSELGISGFEALEKSLEPELDSLKRYKKNQFVEDEHWARRVQDELKPAFEHYGYDPPL